MPIETTYTNARANLAGLLDAVDDDREVVIIKRRGREDAAIISAAELAGLTETAHLLRSPANARRLLEALAAALRNEGRAMTADELRLEVELGSREA